MKNNVGLWIDKTRAFLVYIAENEIGIKTIKSNIDKMSKGRRGSILSASFTGQTGADSDLKDVTSSALLERFYEKIYRGIKNAKSVFIFGPGETKCELTTYIEKQCTVKLVREVETVDIMSDRQIIAKVSKYFKNQVFNQ